MCHNPNFCSRLARQLCLLTALTITSTALGQTVGDTFIDTSEWVQSSSPIRDQGRVQGYITETIVRGYRGPGYDRYYGGGNFQSAVEFSNNEKIQPIVYENSVPSQSASLEPPLRPTPDPVVQAANNGNFRNGIQDGQVRPATLSDMRGFATQASFQQPIQNAPSQNAPIQNAMTNNQFVAPSSQTSSSFSNVAPSAPRRWIQTGYVPQTTSVPQATNAGYPPRYYTNNYYGNQNTYPVRTAYQQPAYRPPVAYTATQANCCDPVYAQTQFVSPPPNTGAGSLRTYPQYGGNPYPNPGYGISQPYVRDTWVPMIPLRSMPYGTYLGQGIIGQPVAYVDGEPVRNFLRYIFP